MDGQQNSSSIQQLAGDVLRLLSLNLDYARLSAAEKLTVLLSAASFYSVVTIMATAVLVFLSIGVGHLLAMTVAPQAAYLLVAVFYVVLLVLLVVFRRRLFVDPVARFISRLLVKPPRQ